MLSQPVVVFSAEAGIFILNLAAFPSGAASAIERIPDATPGIYAWYRSFAYPDDPAAFCEKLLNDVEQKKFIDRNAVVPPHFTVTIASHSTFSEPKKEALKNALATDTFRHDLRRALSCGILFQTPLYIGKASHLRKRIKQHLEPDSPLRTRLQAVGIDIKRCTVLFIPTEPPPASVPPTTELEDIAAEALYEEVFSRLFNPHFSIKYG